MFEVKQLCGQLCLGKQGENLARIVYFEEPDIWKKTFGEGHCELLHQRNGDVAPYPVLLDIENGKVCWKITNADTAIVGEGKCELHYLVDGVVVKSKIWTTNVFPSLGDNLSEPPEEYKAWVDQVLKAAADISESGVSDEKIQEAVNEYLQENPIHMEETDPTVPDWAKQPTKPKYTVDEVEIADGVPLRAEIKSLNNYLDDVHNHITSVEATLPTKADKTQTEISIESKADKADLFLLGEAVSQTNTRFGMYYQNTEVDNLLKSKADISIVGAIAENRQNISTLETDIDGLQKQINEESHFRGYLSTNAKIQVLEATPNDFAYSAESGTKWVYDATDGWVNTETPVPDQLTPASNSTPKMNGEASVGTENAYARGDHRHPTDTTRASAEEFIALKNQTDSLESKAHKETILHHYVVNTPLWGLQPTIDGDLLSVFNTSDFYYVTLKDTNGDKLPDGQFKLMPFYDKYAEAYDQIFYRSTVPTENFPVEFKEIGTNFKLRDAGEAYVGNWTLNINKNFKNDIKTITATVNGSFIQKWKNGYPGLICYTSGNVSTYSNEASVWSSDSSTVIWHWHAYPDSYKYNKYYDTLTVERWNDMDYISTRDSFMRYQTYGSSTWAHKVNRTVGFGKLSNDSVKLTSVSPYGVNDSGWFRNGTEVTIKEVK